MEDVCKRVSSKTFTVKKERNIKHTGYWKIFKDKEGKGILYKD